VKKSDKTVGQVLLESPPWLGGGSTPERLEDRHRNPTHGVRNLKKGKPNALCPYSKISTDTIVEREKETREKNRPQNPQPLQIQREGISKKKVGGRARRS